MTDTTIEKKENKSGKPNGRRLTKVLHEIYLSGAKAFLIEASDGSLILVDTGMPNNKEKILSYLTEIGKSVKDIKYILLTHAHMDHSGSALDIKQASNALLGISDKGRKFVDGSGGLEIPPIKECIGLQTKLMFAIIRVMSKTPMVKVKYVKPDMALKEGVFPESMHVNARILETPGHTEDSISIYLPDEKAVLVGDLLKGGKEKLEMPPVINDMKALLASVEKIKELNPELICVAHGKNHGVSDLAV